MDNILEFFFKINSKENISKDLIKNAYKDILEINDKQKSNIFLSALFMFLILNNVESDIIADLLKISFEKDKFNPYKYEFKERRNNYPIISLSGSGKKGIKTINVSTSAAIIATYFGANIIKPASTATSSVTGSYDFLSYIGINTNIDNKKTIELLKKTGFGFFSIEKLIPKFDKIYGNVFYAPNILSYGLAALLSPFKPDIVLYGLANGDIKKSAEVIEKFGIKEYKIVCGSDDNNLYIDELNIFGTSFICNKDKKIHRYEFGKLLNLPEYDRTSIAQLKDKEENVKISLQVLAGKRDDAYTDIIALNAANILLTSNIVESIEKGFYLVKKELKTGKIMEHLKTIIEESGGKFTGIET